MNHRNETYSILSGRCPRHHTFCYVCFVYQNINLFTVCPYMRFSLSFYTSSHHLRVQALLFMCFEHLIKGIGPLFALEENMVVALIVLAFVIHIIHAHISKLVSSAKTPLIQGRHTCACLLEALTCQRKTLYMEQGCLVYFWTLDQEIKKAPNNS